VLFGNIGIADARTLREDTTHTRYIIELSSYQCEHLTHSPRVAVITNFYPEHLSHHGSLSLYRNAKLNIARFQTKEDIFINGSELETAFAGRIVHPDFRAHFETALLGEHNQRNCAMALSALSAVGVPEHISRQYIKTFKPLPYRLEEVGTYRGVTFYDDSLATIPEATLASIGALPRVDTIILGGEDRGISFEAFADALPATGITTFITFPETGEKMVTRVTPESVVHVSSMEEAVRVAYDRTPKGGTVLLSNASPSFNLFKDYKDKSAQFREAITRGTMTP
jgi:UDP-N-acetylmuramoylalanine--D-glutamate ligase